MTNIKLFLIDLDGTLYIEDTLIHGAKRAIDFLRKNYKICFVTNNSSISKSMYIKKLKDMSIDVSCDELITSTEIIIDYLKKNKLDDSVYLVGTKCVGDEFVDNNIGLNDINPKSVVISFDKELTYEKLEKACHFIRNGAKYIITHKDINCPSSDGFIPDVGSFIKLIEASTGKLPDVVGGKPTKIMTNYIANKYGFVGSEIVFIGDRLYTDMQFANNNNYVSFLVLTGETKRADLKGCNFKIDYVLESIGDIVNLKF